MYVKTKSRVIIIAVCVALYGLEGNFINSTLEVLYYITVNM